MDSTGTPAMYFQAGRALPQPDYRSPSSTPKHSRRKASQPISELGIGVQIIAKKIDIFEIHLLYSSIYLVTFNDSK
jgi:hypothetical protein